MKYPDLAEDELWDYHEFYKEMAKDKTMLPQIRRKARIEAIHLYDEAMATVLPYTLPKPKVYS